jgi:hypothetical protein
MMVLIASCVGYRYAIPIVISRLTAISDCLLKYYVNSLVVDRILFNVSSLTS